MEKFNTKKLRSEIDYLLDNLGLRVGGRQHLAKLLDCHPSTINNAVNGARSGPREIELLIQIHKYLIGLHEYYHRCALVNTKVS